MSNLITYPFGDALMRWDEGTNRYYITEEALLRNGVNLAARLSANRTVDATTVINGLLVRVTNSIYNYIHKHSANNRAQDELIKQDPYARPIIYRALLAQALYIIKNGDPSLSIDPEIRKQAIDENARQELETELEDIRVSLLYAGGGC